MLGKKLGRYEILAKLGAGGMGEVYRARDLSLGREVALKVLPEHVREDADRLRRFEHEARAASALNHPNIVTIYDIGQSDGVPYIAMELVEGHTLRALMNARPLLTKRTLALAAQAAEGLARAHGVGIIHRDLKPVNLMVTRDGFVKILDFGLAKLHEPDPILAPDALTEPATRPGVLMGTVGYMSPEQARGRPVDFRSDQFTVGSILYEMATGRRAFEKETPVQTLAAIIESEPEPIQNLNPEVAPPFRWIVERCLKKNPEERYASTLDLARELRNVHERLEEVSSGPKPFPPLRLGDWSRRRRLTAVAILGVLAALVAGWQAPWAKLRDTPKPPFHSIVVLPLANRSGDPAQEYLVDGITDALTANLGRIGALRVISRTSAMQYKTLPKSLPVIGRELDIEVALEGSVTTVGERVKVAVQLVHAATDRHLWAETYERPKSDLLMLQDEVARRIAEQIQVKLTGDERTRLTGARAVNPAAHEAYLRGRQQFNAYTETSVRKALEHFEQAIKIDAEYAPAYAGVADCYTLQGEQSQTIRPLDAYARAKSAATKALEIDPDLADAHISLAWAKLVLDRDWSAARAGLSRAIVVSPNLATARSRYAWYLAAVGQLDEAIAEMERARQLDPLSPVISAGAAGVLYYARRPAEALKQLQKTLELSPSFVVAHYGLGLTQLQNHRFDAAVSSLRKALELSQGRNPAILADLGRAYAVAGRQDEARQTIRTWRELTDGRFARLEQLAHIHAALGEREEALRLLERAFEERSPGLVWLKVDPRYDGLRQDPRLTDLIRRLGLT